RGLSVGRLAFPRYGTLHADLAADSLHGGQAGLADSPHAMALLFAMDRHAAREELLELGETHDVVLLDRYVASNAAYTAARRGLGGPPGLPPVRRAARRPGRRLPARRPGRPGGLAPRDGAAVRDGPARRAGGTARVGRDARRGAPRPVRRLQCRVHGSPART